MGEIQELLGCLGLLLAVVIVAAIVCGLFFGIAGYLIHLFWSFV